jgi:hypothetical protein
MVGGEPTESEKLGDAALAIFVFAEGDSADAIAAQAKTRTAATITCNQRLNQRVLCISVSPLWRATDRPQLVSQKARFNERKSTLNRAVCHAAKLFRRMVKESSRMRASKDYFCLTIKQSLTLSFQKGRDLRAFSSKLGFLHEGNLRLIKSSCPRLPFPPAPQLPRRRDSL